jgi:hypothetical protein
VNALAELQAWYLSHSNGDWEHAYGIRIETLDNPGWEVRINLRGTELEDRSFTPISDLDPESTWMECHVEDGHFEAHGGPAMLEPMLRVFLDWASVRAPA